MAHVLFVTSYYPPEITAPAWRIKDTAIGLVRLGHQVTILTTFPNFPSGVVPPEYRGYRILREVEEGVQVVRVWSYISPNKGFLRRILAQLSFGCLAPILGGKAVGQPDVIIVESPPLFNAIAGRMLAWFKRCPFIFTVADLWLEAAIQFGMLRNRLLIRLAEWLEWSTYQRASAVWALTEAFRNVLVQRGLSPEKVFVVTNGADTTQFHPLPRNQVRAEFGWDERFTILYAGNHGLSHGLTTILDAADQLRDCTDIHIVLVGDGVKKPELMEQAKRRSLKNVTFLDPMPHDRMPHLFAAADVCLILLRNLPVLNTTFPLRIFEVMACARPFILSAEGIVRQLVEQEAEAGICVEPENATAVVSAIFYLRDHPDQAEILGQRGRAFVEARFDREQLTRVLDAHITTLLEKRTATSTAYQYQ
jgi:colanic acid biosynthesis glycosyl transferase WcaI